MAGARLTGGESAGRRLLTASAPGLRPSTAVVRAACFNILGPTVPGAAVVDLFAGIGSLGLEALSRGASHATFVEVVRERAQVIEANLRLLHLEDRAEVVVRDAQAWIADAGATLARSSLILLDPPYGDRGPDQCRRVLERLGDIAGALPDWEPSIVVEHHREVVVPITPGALNCVRTARYGTTVLSFYRRRR